MNVLTIIRVNKIQIYTVNTRGKKQFIMENKPLTFIESTVLK